MPYHYSEERGKTCVVAEGGDIKDAFVAGAQGLFDMIVDNRTVRSQTSLHITVDAKSETDLFSEWLNELLREADVNKMVFSEFEVSTIQKVGDKQYLLTGVAWGESIDKSRHKIKKSIKKAMSAKEIEVKGKKMCAYQCAVE